MRTDPQEIINTMFLEELSLTKTIVLEKDPQVKLDINKGSAKVEKYLPNEVTINTKADGSSLLFLSDSYYPGWKAYVDNTQTEIFRSDFTFRSVVVPKGEHTVKFVYDPMTFKVGLILSVIGLILILIGVVTKGRFILFPKI